MKEAKIKLSQNRIRCVHIFSAHTNTHTIVFFSSSMSMQSTYPNLFSRDASSMS